MIHRDVLVGHEQGVHALVAHELAVRAAGFASSLYLRHEGRSASLTRVVDILALGLAAGIRVTVWADGEDEAEALDALAGYLASPEQQLKPITPAPPGAPKGEQ